MFGYIKTDFPNLYIKDSILYKAVYCGLCKSIGELCGQRGRFLLNYDLAFLSAFLHNVSGIDFEIKREHCILHRLSKRPVAKSDDLSLKIAGLNVILAHYKLTDDIDDENKGRAKRSLIKKAYKKAKKFEPSIDEIVKKEYSNLRKLERENSDSIDITSDPFGNMIKNIVTEILGDKTTENIKNVSYNLGKWIYLIDAVDDYDKDKKSKSFNVFFNAYKESDKESLLKNHNGELGAIFGTVLMEIANNAKDIEYSFNHDLIDNIFYKGLIQQTKKILENNKCKSTTKF